MADITTTEEPQVSPEDPLTSAIQPKPVSLTPPGVSPPAERIKVTDDDKEAFFKAFLADQPFEETIFMLGGKSKAVFRTLTVQENDVVFAQIAFDQAAGTARNTDAYMIKIMQYRVAGSLKSMDDIEFCPEITMESFPSNKDTGKTYLAERLALMQKWQVYKLAGVNDAFNRFEAKVQKLTEETFKENF
jgi:hypothetical protein